MTACLPAVCIYSNACGLGFFADDYLFLNVLDKKRPLFFMASFFKLMDGYFFRPAGAAPWLLGELLGNSAFAHHLINVGIHVVNSLLVGCLAWLVLPGEPGTKGARKLAAGTIAGLIFLYYPAQAEAVFWVSGRFDLLCTLFALLALIAYLVHLRKPSLLYLPFISLFIFLSMLSKETGALFAIAVFALEIQKTSLFRKAFGKRSSPSLAGQRLQRVCAVFLGVGAYLFFRIRLNWRLIPESKLSESFGAKIYNNFSVIFGHLTAPVWPAEGIFVVPWWAFLLPLFMLLLWLVLKKEPGSASAIILAVVLIVLPLAPAVVYQWHYREWAGSRLLYPALPGWSVLWAIIAAEIFITPSWKRSVAGVLLPLYLVLCIFQLRANLFAFQAADKKVKNVLNYLEAAEVPPRTREIYLWDFPQTDSGVMLFFRNTTLTAAFKRALPKEKAGNNYRRRRIEAFHAGRTGERRYVMELPALEDVKNKKAMLWKWDRSRNTTIDLTDRLGKAYMERTESLRKLDYPLKTIRLGEKRKRGLFPMNDLNKPGEKGKYRITGPDPFYLTGSLKLNPLLVREIKIKMEIESPEQGSSGDIQFFWRTSGSSFNEDMSLIFSAPVEKSVFIKSLPLGSVPDFVLQKDIAQLRLDPPAGAGSVKVHRFDIVPVQKSMEQ